jgi:hypothetical protein
VPQKHRRLIVKTKRDMLTLYLTGGAAALVLAGCTAQQISDTEKKVADLINQVQKGVAAGCSAIGKVVPTANTVFAVLAALVGGSNVLVATGAMISQAIADLVAIGCPATPGLRGTKTQQGTPVDFY